MATYGYTRVSTDKQANEGESLTAQKRTIEGYAMMLGLEVAEVAKMNGLAHDGGGATKAKQRQPSWRKRCELATDVTTSEAGLKARKTGKRSMTYHQRMSDHGTRIVAAGRWRREGEDKQQFFVSIPPTTQVRPGLRVSTFAKECLEQARETGEDRRHAG